MTGADAMQSIRNIWHEVLVRLRDDEDGAVTVDWVVLTAAVVGLSIALYTTIGHDTHDYSEKIGTHMSSMGIRTY